MGKESWESRCGGSQDIPVCLGAGSPRSNDDERGRETASSPSKTGDAKLRALRRTGPTKKRTKQCILESVRLQNSIVEAAMNAVGKAGVKALESKCAGLPLYRCARGKRGNRLVPFFFFAIRCATFQTQPTVCNHQSVWMMRCPLEVLGQRATAVSLTMLSCPISREIFPFSRQAFFAVAGQGPRGSLPTLASAPSPTLLHHLPTLSRRSN